MGETKRLTIDFCNSNLMAFTQSLLQELREAHPDWNIGRYGCLTNCGECGLYPFAIVDDQIVSASTVDELRAKIEELGQPVSVKTE
jgi:uncharacterized protein YuzB (UPF0349 family)